MTSNYFLFSITRVRPSRRFWAIIIDLPLSLTRAQPVYTFLEIIEARTVEREENKKDIGRARVPQNHPVIATFFPLPIKGTLSLSAVS